MSAMRQINGEPQDDGIFYRPQMFTVTAPSEVPVEVPTEETPLREDFLGRLTSRKFLVWVGTVLALISQLILGNIDPTAFITAFVAAGATYQAAEGVADHGNRQ